MEHEAKFSVVEFETLQDLPREYEINIITFSKYTFFLLWGYPNNIFNNGICVDMLIIGYHSVFEYLVEIKLHTLYIVFLDDKFYSNIIYNRADFNKFDIMPLYVKNNSGPRLIILFIVILLPGMISLSQHRTIE